MELTEFLSSRKVFITTPLIFLVFLVLFSKVNSDVQSFAPSLVLAMNGFTARLSVKLLAFLNIKAEVEKSYILLPLHGQIEIIYECTGIYILLLFASFILSYPTPLSRKLLGIFLGIPLLYSFNLFRIAILGILEIYSPGLFDFFHLYLWEATFIAFVLLVAYLWITWISEMRHKILGRHQRFIKPILKFALFSIFFFIIIRIFLNPYILLQQRLLQAVLESDLFGLRTSIEISVNKGVMWLKESNGASQSVRLTHLIFNLVPFLALTMVLRLNLFQKILSIVVGTFLILISHILWLTLVSLRVISPELRILPLLNLYQMINLALPILLWIPLLYISKARSGVKREGEPLHPIPMLKPGESFSYPRFSRIIFYLLLGVVSPLLLLLSAFKVNLGYFIAFTIWVLGVSLILPEPPFILRFKNTTKSVLISLLFFWQIPLTASTFIYIPSYQRIGLITSSGRFSLLEEGVHFRLPLRRREVFFELSTRSFTFPVSAYSDSGEKVIDAEVKVSYHIPPQAKFEKIYRELGKDMVEIDRGVSSLCRTATIWTLSRSGYLRNWQKSGSTDTFHLNILSQAQTFLNEYSIAIEKIEFTNREGAKIKL